VVAVEFEQTSAVRSNPQNAIPVFEDCRYASQGGAGRFLLPAAALLVIASAAAVITVRPSLLEDLSHGAAPAGTTPGAAAPEAATPSTPGAAPAQGGSDLLERAAAQTSEADRVRTAEAHDAAAAAWEEAIPELQSDPDELAAGRREIAAARYQAWTEGGTPDRRQAATRAVRAYLLCAPPGADRDRAWTWLAALKR